MAAPPTHPDETGIDSALVARLVAEQFPRWAGLPVTPVPSAGTDNAMYRLGDDKAVRLPRDPGAARQIGKEQRWLPHLAPRVVTEHHYRVTNPVLAAVARRTLAEALTEF